MCVDPASLTAIGAYLFGSAATAASTSSVVLPLSGLTAAVTTPAVAAVPGLLTSVAGLTQVAGVGGTLLTAAGAIQQGQASKASADYNAEVARRQALDATRRGSIAEGEQRTKTRQLAGQQHAAMGASEIVADEGSFGDILAQSAQFGERDAQRIRVNAQREAFGLRSEADLSEFQGQQAETAGLFKGGTSLLTGAFNLFTRKPWYDSLVDKSVA